MLYIECQKMYTFWIFYLNLISTWWIKKEKLFTDVLILWKNFLICLKIMLTELVFWRQKKLRLTTEELDFGNDKYSAKNLIIMVKMSQKWMPENVDVEDINVEMSEKITIISLEVIEVQSIAFAFVDISPL